ncbi:glycosyltransferase family 90 protein [Cadophora sp. MPI-SDFR-AT-0126]|nr:glycosyltransferase family 90 protein [Leotiomycetes sp. MPI-SDFR-AT-0126]
MDKRKLVLFCTFFVSAFIVANFLLLSSADLRSKIKNIALPLPGSNRWPGQSNTHGYEAVQWHQDKEYFEDHAEVKDDHPISALMRHANKAWKLWDNKRSKSFRETVERYRKTYERNPPPGFKEWYRFARERGVYNIDDFGQIMDDLRPFWGVEPEIVRKFAGHMHEDPKNGLSGLHIRDHKVWKLTNANWRVETFAKIVKPFVHLLPDMDISINRLDQPRVVVPWDDMQELLSLEAASRKIHPKPTLHWSKNMAGLLKDNETAPTIMDPKFFEAAGKPLMPIAREACPPESRARKENLSRAHAWYKDGYGFVANFNRSTDLCVVGPDIQDKHGLLSAPSSMVVSKQLLPIFGECKVNVNSDVLFPANMYYMDDERYLYDPKLDYDWDDKKDILMWRGVTSGGANTAENWRAMHRQRLVLFTNGTDMADKESQVLSEDPELKGAYRMFEHFNVSDFASEHTDVGFTGAIACVPDCTFYDAVIDLKNRTTMSEQFLSKFLIDVDGHSFSGRWHAFLKSKSLGIKSTIFREWHDSRLFAWRHFVPLDNGYEELYSILAYFIGIGSVSEALKDGHLYVPRHDFEARKLGRQGREWAAKVLRREDIEIYTFRLLIEYARVIDDNRHALGYSGDGSELDRFDAKHPFP